MPTPSGLTPLYGLPYLLESDVPDIATASQVLAQAVENLITGMRVGLIEICPSGVAPTGALLSHGQAVSRTTYSALFAKIGTTYGVGDGSTTFNLPNCPGNTLVGLKTGDANFGTLGAIVGQTAQTLAVGHIPSMTPTISITDPGHNHSSDNNGNTSMQGVYTNPASGTTWASASGDLSITYGGNVTAATTGITATSSAVGTVSNSPVPVIQPSLVVDFAIWYE